jgi:hypothetical protein
VTKPGPKPKGVVDITWSSDFAYAVGLFTADGCLSSNGRHLDFTSQDEEQLENFVRCLGIEHVKISEKENGKDKKCGRVQFGDVLFYSFLEDIGLTTAKSKTIGSIDIPDPYFFDFLRGLFDGDGCFYSFWDKRWESSYMFYTVFNSASEYHIDWLRENINKLIDIRGHICKPKNSKVYKLKYAKDESMNLLRNVYYSDDITYLSRKRLKIKEALAKVDMQL